LPDLKIETGKNCLPEGNYFVAHGLVTQLPAKSADNPRD
jgi:hypothetical protein